MTFLERHPSLPQAIESSKILSDGQKKLLTILVQFDAGVPISQIMELMNSSKQTIHFNMKKLLKRGYVLREKEMVFIYKANQSKMVEILEREDQTNKAALPK